MNIRKQINKSIKSLKINCIRYLIFKPLYWIEKKIDPSCKIGKPKYKRFQNMVYKISKQTLK